MKNRLAIITILAASVAMLLSGCDPTLEQDGKRVRFTAKSRGFITTKTSYSGEIVEDKGKRWERIDWIEGDQIRILSPETKEGVLWSPNGALEPRQIYTDNPWLHLLYSDYNLNVISPGENRRYSTAKLYNDGDNGLTWTGNPAVFYGLYPIDDNRIVLHGYDYEKEVNGQNKTFQDLLVEIKIPGATGDDKQTGDPTFVSTMPLLAKTDELGTGSHVTLDFDPYFSAYEFNLKSEDQAITVNSVTLSAEEGYISGKLFWNLTAGEPFDYQGDLTGNSKTITIPGSWAIDKNTSARITIFGLPNDLKYITIIINFTSGGTTKNATLKLYNVNNPNDPNDPDNPPTVFYRFQKTRINGILKSSSWELTIKTDVKDWTYYSEELSSLNQINVDPLENGKPATVKVTGGIQTTQKWMDAHGGKSNDYIPYDGYDGYYQLRTLNWNQPEGKRFFEISFTPVAPYGGYWELVPEFIGTNSENHFRYEVKIQGVSEWVNWVAQDSPHGQIMKKKVYIRIYPKDLAQNDDNVYEMIFKAYFSPHANFDPIYSADSELQDVHGSGLFSYWRFRIDRIAGSGDYPLDPEGKDEHESFINGVN